MPDRYVILKVVISLCLLLVLCTGCFQPAGEPAVSPTLGASAFSLQNQTIEEKVYTVYSISIENCNGNSPVKRTETITETTTTSIELTLNTSLEVNVLQSVKAQLSSMFHKVDGQSREVESIIELEALPSTHVNYQVVWNEIWRVGDIVITDNLVIPYRVRTNLQPSISSGMPQVCP